MRSQEELVDIAQCVAEEIMESWFQEDGSWSYVMLAEKLTEEEYNFIQDNIRVNVQAKFK